MRFPSWPDAAVSPRQTTANFLRAARSRSQSERTVLILPATANHPGNPKIAREAHLPQDIPPRLPGRIFLPGFSKSSNGAMTPLLRNPGGFAAAPLLLDASGKYGAGDIFGTPENFAGYHVLTLLEKQAGAGPLGIAISGYGSFQSGAAGAH